MLHSKRSGSDALAWWIVLATTILLLFFLVGNPFDSNEQNDGDLARLVKRILPSTKEVKGEEVFVEGALLTTIKFTLTAISLSLLVGIMLGLMRVTQFWWLRLPASLYIEFVRGIPLLVLILICYYGLTTPIEISGQKYQLSEFWGAVAGLVLCYSAYIGEVIRAGVESLPREQIEAAYLEGTHFQVAWYVVLPQAVRNTLPAVGNEFIALLKDSALLSVVAIDELTLIAKNYATSTFNYFQSFFLIALIYLLITLILSKIVRLLEKAWNVN